MRIGLLHLFEVLGPSSSQFFPDLHRIGAIGSAPLNITLSTDRRPERGDRPTRNFVHGPPKTNGLDCCPVTKARQVRV